MEKRKLSFEDVNYIYDTYWRATRGKTQLAYDLASQFEVSLRTVRKIIYDPTYRRSLASDVDLDDDGEIVPERSDGGFPETVVPVSRDLSRVSVRKGVVEVKTWFLRKYGERPRNVPDGWEIYVSEYPIAGHLSFIGNETAYGYYYAAVASYKPDAARVRYFIATSGGVLLKFVSEKDIRSWAARRGFGRLDFDEMKRVYFRSNPRKEITIRLHFFDPRDCKNGCGYRGRTEYETRRHESICHHKKVVNSVSVGQRMS